GLRYLRAKRREAFVSLITVISILGVMIAVMTLDIALAVTTGFEKDLRDRILGFNPHIVISNYGGPIEKPAELLDKIAKQPGVSAAAPFVYAQAMVSHRAAVVGVFLRGVEPERASDVVDIGRYLREGNFADMGKLHEVDVEPPRKSKAEQGAEEAARRRVSLPGLVIGEELKQQLGAGVGAVVTVFSPIGAPSAAGMIPRMRRFVVVGVFDSGMYEFDAGVVYASLKEAQSLLGLTGVSGVEIRVTDIEDAAHIGERLEKDVLRFPYEARDWMQMNRNVFIALRLEKVVYFLVLSLMLVVAAFSILATLVMVVMEKRKDIAILKSMGATDRSIARIFVLKGLVIGVLGTIVGNVVGLVLIWLISKYRLPLPKGVFFVQTVPVVLVPEYFAAVSGVAILICFLVTLYPASRAARIAPVDVIRYE
ncbi:MAG: FtsX-like permease family protein, partial [Candidatus Binatia bacterium]